MTGMVKLTKGNPKPKNKLPANNPNRAKPFEKGHHGIGVHRQWWVARAPFRGEWAELYEGYRSELADKYGALGPQYRLLCEMLASAWTHIRRAEAAGQLDVTTPQYTRVLELLRRIIDQTQRYTEARKSEIITTEVNNAVRETLLIVETHLIDNPDLFRRIVLAVRDRVLE